MDNFTKIAEMLSEQIQQELATEYTLSDIEKTTRRLVQEIGRRALAVVVNSQEKPHPAPVSEICASLSGSRLLPRWDYFVFL